LNEFLQHAIVDIRCGRIGEIKRKKRELEREREREREREEGEKQRKTPSVCRRA